MVNVDRVSYRWGEDHVLREQTEAPLFQEQLLQFGKKPKSGQEAPKCLLPAHVLHRRRFKDQFTAHSSPSHTSLGDKGIQTHPHMYVPLS